MVFQATAASATRYPMLLSSLTGNAACPGSTAALPSRWWLHHGSSVSDVKAPSLLVHRAVVRPAQGDEVVELGGTTVRPVDDVVPVNPQMYVGQRPSHKGDARWRLRWMSAS
jgi:hypothetical protein